MIPARALLIVGLITGLVPVLDASDRPKTVAAATLQRWRDCGITVSWLDQSRGPNWRPGNLAFGEPDPGEPVIPLFDFPENQTLPRLDVPTPEGPFGIRLSPRQFDDPALKPIRAMKTLTAVYLRKDSKITPETLAALREVTGLVELGLWASDPDQAVLADLNTLPKLQTLSVWAPVKDETIAAWGKLEHLRELNLREGRGFRGTGLKALTQLRHLTLNQASVGDEGLAAMAALKELQTLNLSFTDVTDQGLAHLKDLPNLTALNLYDTTIGDAGLKDLPTSLTRLNLRNARGVTDTGLKDVARLSRLAHLNLSQTRITDTGIKELARLTGLKELDLSSTRMSDASLKELTRLTGLKKLDVGGTNVTPAGQAAFQKAVPGSSLEEL